MTVPKKRHSKSKRNTRKSKWKTRIVKLANNSYSLAKSILNKGKTTFLAVFFQIKRVM